ncbi:MAG: hypothetical protein ACXW3Z_01020 [Limisphaerales bacterium]
MKHRLMDAHAELLELYQEWKQLTEKEGAAILASNWGEVRSCQKAKQQLQPRIIHATDLAKHEPGGGPEFETQIRECVNELIQLEALNSQTLEKRLQEAEKERCGLQQTSHRLKRVQKSYTGARGSAWDGQYS